MSLFPLKNAVSGDTFFRLMTKKVSPKGISQKVGHMPRKYTLTWQAGSGSRTGRWRKKYRGVTYYFCGGRGKTDREAYQAAVDEWNSLKKKLDEAADNPYEEEYETAISEWEAIMRWSVQHNDDERAKLARQKLKELRTRLVARRPQPLTPDDRFQARFISCFESSAIPDLGGLLGLPESPENLDKATVVDPASLSPMPGSPEWTMREIWKDRIENQQLQRTLGCNSIGDHASIFLEGKQAQVEAGEISAGRYANLVLQLKAFQEHVQDHVGETNPVSAITAEILMKYRTELLRRVGSQELSKSYAKDRLDVAKQFIRWLWATEVLDKLPRNLASLTIGVPPNKVISYSLEEVNKLLGKANDRMKLYMLLALNAAMTQVDISELQKSEVDWRRGRITRKRSKTKTHANPPTVSYKLWPQTFRLLQKFKTETGDRVLVSRRGTPLKVAKLHGDGRFLKIDSIGRSFNRFCKSIDLKGANFKRLRKTSPSLMMGSKYSGLRTLFLGNVPREIADINYTDPPEDTLDEAIAWLGQQYGVDKK
jgi:integrase